MIRHHHERKCSYMTRFLFGPHRIDQNASILQSQEYSFAALCYGRYVIDSVCFTESAFSKLR